MTRRKPIVWTPAAKVTGVAGGPSEVKHGVVKLMNGAQGAVAEGEASAVGSSETIEPGRIVSREVTIHEVESNACNSGVERRGIGDCKGKGV